MPFSLFSVEDNPHLYHACERIVIEINSRKSSHYFNISTGVDRIITTIQNRFKMCMRRNGYVLYQCRKIREFERSRVRIQL